MQKKIILMVFALMTITVLVSGCIDEERIQKAKGEQNEKWRQVGMEIAWQDVNLWCGFYSHFEKEENSNRYFLGVKSGGDGNVTVSFSFDDQDAAIHGEDYMNQYFVGNSTWKTFMVAYEEFHWSFFINATLSDNITLTVTKDLEPFSFCQDCRFQPIVKELTFKPEDDYRGFL